jgi:hypothetical protein
MSAGQRCHPGTRSRTRYPGPPGQTQAAKLNLVTPRHSRDRLHPENLVYFLRGEGTVTRSNGAEDLGVKLDLVERHPVVDTKIETLTHRSHLHRRADPQRTLIQGYDVTGVPA